ncbi:hypothetical protein EB796_013437 [Bugula neritina]|uniref:Fucosyltransferase n=1 Tax=Bugula neritina TaxID=10212 RepID=A0A7J7JS32_BUGNE|nr:hypothetical protein EB796_013437 [Bugula neritina]
MVVPLVLGKRNAYHQLAPPNSYIHAEQFDSPQHLAAYLHMLDKDPVLYHKYFEWRLKYMLVDVPRPYCQMCETFREKWFEPSQVDMHKYHGFNRCWQEGRSMPIRNWKDKLANHSSYKSIDPWVTISSLNSQDKPLRFT